MADVVIARAGGKNGNTNITAAGLVAATTPATCDNDGATLLLVVVGATPTNLTINQQPCTHGRSTTQVNALLANTSNLLGPWPRDEFNDPTGKLNFTFSSVATVTVAAIRLA